MKRFATPILILMAVLVVSGGAWGQPVQITPGRSWHRGGYQTAPSLEEVPHEDRQILALAAACLIPWNGTWFHLGLASCF